MILFSHPLGNTHSRQAALAVEEAGLLAELWTCLNWTPGNPLERWLPARVTRELGRRSYPAPLRPKLRTAPWREALRLLAARLPVGGPRLTRHETGVASVDAVYQGLDRAVARRLPAAARGLRGVYAYEDGAADTFRVAGELGLTRFYDLPIGYWRTGRAIFDEEAAREPGWAPTLTGRADSPAKLARKDRELAGADAVIVASSFTRSTLADVPHLRAPVHVVPYGGPAPMPVGELVADHRRGGAPLRVLFAGSLGQRKGISYLLDAVGRLGTHVELTLLGTKTVDGCAPLEHAVRAHRWIPSLPHAAVLAEMSRQDVLVFPSLFEGFGLVIAEALSRGLPVITTAHTAGPDLLDDGVDGFLVPIRSASAIAEKLELLFDPARRLEMRHAALRKAALLSWETHRRLLGDCLTDALAKPTESMASTRLV